MIEALADFDELRAPGQIDTMFDQAIVKMQWEMGKESSPLDDLGDMLERQFASSGAVPVKLAENRPV